MNLNRSIAVLTLRLLLGFIFFFQGYGKVFKFGLDGVYQNFFLKGYSELLPKFLLLFTAYYTSLIEYVSLLRSASKVRLRTPFFQERTI